MDSLLNDLCIDLFWLAHVVSEKLYKIVLKKLKRRFITVLLYIHDPVVEHFRNILKRLGKVLRDSDKSYTFIYKNNR